MANQQTNLIAPKCQWCAKQIIDPIENWSWLLCNECRLSYFSHRPKPDLKRELWVIVGMSALAIASLIFFCYQIDKVMSEIESQPKSKNYERSINRR